MKLLRKSDQALEQNITQPLIPRSETRHAWARCARYLCGRVITVGLTVLVGVYVAIWVSNIGGYADAQRRHDVRSETTYRLFMQMGTHLVSLPADEKHAVIEGYVTEAFKAADLDQPFIVRSFRYFRDAFSFNLGESTRKSRAGSHNVLDILLDRMPRTLSIFAAANLITFLLALLSASFLSRRYGSFIDRIAAVLVPLFAAPPWFHGIFLIVLFAAVLKVLPFGGYVDVPLPTTSIGYALSYLKHMILPVMACVLGTLPMALYTNRSLFLIHSAEDYVELAKAKGLREARLQSRYILRPVLPTIITSFVLITMISWQGIILTEHVFAWPGIGELLVEAISGIEVNIVIGLVTLFAYLLGISVFALDLVYVSVDPRVTLGKRGGR